MARYEAVESFTGRKRIRKSFGKLREVVDVPNLIEVQKASYDTFLQMDVVPDKRAKIGLQAALSELFPIKESNGRAELEFISYDLFFFETSMMRKKHHVIYRPERHILAKTANEFFLLKNDLIARLFRLIIFNICWKSISPYIQSGRLFDTADDVWGKFPLAITGNTVFENFYKQRCHFQR